MNKHTIFALILLIGIEASSQSIQKKTTTIPWSVRMAQSEIIRFPVAWQYETSKPFWGYHQGVTFKAMLDMWRYTGDKRYYEYTQLYGDSVIAADGTIRTYNVNAYNIDMINAGKILFTLYNETGDEKYKKAIQALRQQMRDQPRTSEGGFWHKQRYPYQMWLDGLYMGAPFLAQYAKEFDEPELLDDVVNQVRLLAKHTYDPKTGLYYHAWDESREQQWANKQTGQSPNFWGRSIGWFAMALVDILDFLPKDHPGRNDVIHEIKKLAAGIKTYQDKSSGVWYQVVDQGNRKGNYLESTASSMFVYFLYKGVREGYLDKTYLSVANKGYHGILKTFIRENENGTISLTRCCAVAGLGGNPYRDGSYEYYINERIRDDDPKGIGPFIWASMENERQRKQ